MNLPAPRMVRPYAGESFTLSEQDSSLEHLENDSLRIRDSTPLGKLHGLVRFALWRVPLAAIRALLWLAFLGVLHSVFWFACILAGRFVLYRSLSALRGGTQFSLAPTLLALLRWSTRRAVVSASGIWRYSHSFTLKPRWYHLALISSGAFFLFGVIVSLLGWGD